MLSNRFNFTVYTENFCFVFFLQHSWANVWAPTRSKLFPSPQEEELQFCLPVPPVNLFAAHWNESHEAADPREVGYIWVKTALDLSRSSALFDFKKVTLFFWACFPTSLSEANDSMHITKIVTWVMSGTKRSSPSLHLSLIHIWRCRRVWGCRSRWSPYH